jgi:hypothetical protein
VVKRGRKSTRPHDDAGYRKRRKLLKDSITAHTRCARCGKLASRHPTHHKSGRPAGWETGHVIDGDNRGPLALEWSTCNRRAGGALGYERGIGRARANGGPPPGWTPGPHLAQHYSDDPTSPGVAPCLAHSGQLCATCRAYHGKKG